MPRLTLKAVDFRDPQHWRWTLTDHNGVYLGDHEVRLDSRSPDYLALLDLYGHLERYCLPDRRRQEETRILDQLGAWAGPLALHDVSLIFQVEGDARRHDLHPVGRRLRVLAVFSLPEGQSALNLRRERYQLSRLFNGLAGQRGLAIDVRVLQYGVTRRTLQRVLEEGEGWDLIHFSGHGGAAVLILETAARMPDPLPSADLVALLKPARARLKWVTLSACSSAAATIEETLRWLDLKPRRDAPPAAASTDRRELTALARALVRELDCAVLAMRFPVEDDFAIHLAEQVYGGVLAQGNSLDRALQIALGKIRNAHSALSIVTPPSLALAQAISPSPLRPLRPSAPPGSAWRISPSLRSTSSDASPRSPCTLELAFHYEKLDRFTDFIWFHAGALRDFALQWELQVRDAHDQPRLPFSHLLANPAEFKNWLPRLKQFLRENSVLIVLDNLEPFLLSDGRFRDETWTALLAALLDHHGLSRTILTSRIEPALPNRDRQGADRLLTRPIHALPLDEAALLARQLPNLGVSP